MSALDTVLRAAAARRAELARDTDALRLVDGAPDGLPGVVVERYGVFGRVELRDADPGGRLSVEIALGLLSAGLGLEGVYGRARPRADLRRREAQSLAPALPLVGRDAPRPLEVTERGLTFLVELGAGLSTGLFTDQRDGRSRVRAAAGGARVLNLFCYTGSFTVAAAAGGAAETVSVDLSASALRGLNRNLDANGLAGPRHRVFREDALRYLPRARRRGERFDLVVLDPPSFGTRGQGTFSVERDHARLLEDALAVTAPGGALLAVTHHRGVTAEGLATLVRSLAPAAGHEGLTVEPLRPPLDHPDLEHGARSVWARVGG